MKSTCCLIIRSMGRQQLAHILRLPCRTSSASIGGTSDVLRRPAEDRTSIFPEALEALWGQLGIAHGVHDVFVAEVVLEGPSVPAIVGKFVATGMPEHVRMDRELELGCDRDTREHFPEAGGGHGCTALGH